MSRKFDINSNLVRVVALSIVLLIFLPKTAVALDFRDFTYRHLRITDGISNQRIFSIRQTPDGVVWWTTKCGVDRTNGAEIDNYSLNENSKKEEKFSSFAGRVIKLAHVASAQYSVLEYNQIFAFDNVGKIFKYDEVQDRFDYLCNVSAILGQEIVLKDVLVTEDGFIIALREGVFRLTPVESRCNSEDNYQLTPISIGIYANEIDAYNNDELIVCAKEGVFVLPSVAKSKTKLKKIAPYNSESAYYDSTTGLLWIGTYDSSVKVLNPHNSTVIADYSSAINNNPIRRIVPFDKNSMLIGIDGYGVYCADRQSPTVHTPTTLFDASDGRTGVLHGNGVYDILVDSLQNLFIGTYSGGIDIARPVGCTVAIYKHVAGNSQSLANGHVNTVMEYSPDILLMGTDDGISRLDVMSGEWKHFARGYVVLDVCKSATTGNLLIATYGSGVCEIGADGKAHPLFTKENGKLHDNHVFCILYDHNNQLWIGSLFGSLAVSTDKGMKYYEVNGVNSLTLLSDGRIAVGTTHGLYLVDDKKGTIHEVNYTPAGCPSANRFVQDVYETDDKRIWIATDGGGVYVCGLKSGKLVPELQLTEDEGLPSNTVCNITSDSNGQLWFATDRGLAFTPSTEPRNVANVNYGYGLMAEYVRGCVTNLNNGKVLYGTVYGAQVVNPSHIQRLNYTARLHIRGVHVSEIENGFEQFRPNELFNKQVFRMLQKDELRLKYSQRSFEILFEGVNQRHYYDVAYQYKVGDNNWSQPSEVGDIRFENLEAGEHVLYIRCISKSCGKELETREIHIFISQPWWNSWWMWIVYLALFVLTFLGVWKFYDLHTKYMSLVLKTVETKVEENIIVPPVQQVVNVDDKPVEEEKIVEDEPLDDIASEDETHNDKEASIFIETATNIVLENISDIDFNINTLCRNMAMSRTLFYVKLKTYTGKSPQDFIRVIRLNKAATLLRKGYSVTDVSSMVGFENPKYFSTVFKKYFEVSPSKYQ